MEGPLVLMIHFELEIDGHTVGDEQVWGPFESIDAAWDFYRDNPGLRAHPGGLREAGAGVARLRAPDAAARHIATLASWGVPIPTEPRDPRAEWAEATRNGVEVPERTIRELLGADDG